MLFIFFQECLIEFVPPSQSGNEDIEDETSYNANTNVAPAENSSIDAHRLPLKVHVKRRETERQTEIRLHSHAHLKQIEDAEVWQELKTVCSEEMLAIERDFRS